MLYGTIIKKLIKRKGLTQEQFGNKIGITQNKLANRLTCSFNPQMRETLQMLEALGYEIAFVPKGTIEDSPALSEVCFVPELPSKPEKNSEK